MLSPEELKKRYREQWARSNQRERFVLLYLKTFLRPEFRPELTGLGAGSSSYIDRSYGGLLEAFDITIFYNDYPLAFVDVTGVVHSSMAKPRVGYCVGEWKLEKAYKYKVEGRVWIAFVIEGESTILWAPLTKFYSSMATRTRLYEDEQPVRCLQRKNWHPWDKPNWASGKIPFNRWLQLKVATEGPLRIPKAARG